MIIQNIWRGYNLKIVFETMVLGVFLLAGQAVAFTEVQLTMNPADDTLGVYSPDGNKIAFVSGASGSNEIWVMNADGNGQTELTTLGLDAWESPVWSPDGTEIAFSTRYDYDIYKVSSNGLTISQLTNSVHPPYDERWQKYSPDGSKISYSRLTNGWSEVWIMNPDGTSQIPLATEHSQDDYAVWSPDGTKISYSYGSDFNQPLSLALMNADGSGKQTIASFSMTYGFKQAWSPDSSKIVFSASSSTANPSDRGVCVINIDGSDITKIANGDIRPQTQSWQSQVWSPDGSKIVYYSKDSGNFDIWMMNTDGSNKEQLTTSTGDDVEPYFSPDGRKILFESNRNGNWDIYVIDLVSVIPAIIDINPNTLNLKSSGKYITAYIELPDGYDVNYIDTSRVNLVTPSGNSVLVDTSAPVIVGDYDRDGLFDLMVEFDRATVVSYLSGSDNYEVTLKIIGELADETSFEGTDTIRVIKKG
jgi:Tol biopolymer transport system component